jgi:excisionase family DNA binding protein
MHSDGAPVTPSSTGVRGGVPDPPAQCHHVPMPGTPRFLTLADVAEVLNTSSAQVYALVRRGDLVAIKIGGRGQWRVETEQLEAYIRRMYDEAATFVAEHPYEEEREPQPGSRPET